eukprot:scaffold136436_cov17-Tisochrysis_lutea.AAC.1
MLASWCASCEGAEARLLAARKGGGSVCWARMIDPVIACHNSVGSAAEQLNGSCSQLRSSNVDIPAQQARPFMLALLLPDLQDVTII